MLKIFNVHQISTEGKNMQQAFNIFLDDIILENAQRYPDYYSLFVSDLPYIDQKMFLSYLTDPHDFEFYTSNPVREREAIKDYSEEMQGYINERINDLFFEVLQEKRSA